MKWTTEYPLAELIACLGFFLVFLVEETVLALIPSIGHRGHSHGSFRSSQRRILRISAPNTMNNNVDHNHPGHEDKNNHHPTDHEQKVPLKCEPDNHFNE